MDVCKCIVTARHGITLNSPREVGGRPLTPQGTLPLNLDRTKQNRTVICMMLKATANDRRTSRSSTFLGLPSFLGEEQDKNIIRIYDIQHAVCCNEPLNKKFKGE
ncbi:hypothetical protein TNCV_1748571 [Trichonephila clavipes]|nr:hypothetical protein TNCV_1748571 [Trichonephila clavipes]